ncbi:MAG: hypothetical protein ABR608_13495 [Pseudonocardiaceae bacterium]
MSEIIKGRVVKEYVLLERIAEGLGIPREYLGLSWRGADGTYCGEVPVAELPEGVSAEMLRRHLLAFGASTAFGAPIKGLGELAEHLPRHATVPPPSQLFPVHVEHVRDLTRDLRATLLNYGSNPKLSSAAAAWADQLLGVPGPHKLTRELRIAVVELHILVAGWAGLDAGLDDRALYHYSRGLELATETGNAYLQAIALACAGLTMLEHGHPDEGLKMLQFAQVKTWSIPPEHDRRMVESCALADSAIAYAFMGTRRPQPPQWPSPANCGGPPAATREATRITWPRAWRSAVDGSTSQNRSPWPRYTVGRASASCAAPTPPQCWPPSTSRPANRTGCT